MSRSLIRQLEQIRNSYVYDDVVVDVNIGSVAEPTISGTLEGDLNVFRTLLKDMKGTSDWYGDLGNYFDPKNTDIGNTETKDLNLSNIKNNTLDAKTLIIPIKNDNANAGYTVSGTSTGVLLSVTTQYADAADRTGLPIFASTGDYYDEGGTDLVTMVDVFDLVSGGEFQDASGNIIYGKLHDGADNGGAGDGTDVYVKFYANDVEVDLSGVVGLEPTKIGFVYPQRYTMADIPEGFLRRDFVTGIEGDVELLEDIYNLWQFTGGSDGDASPQPWTDTGAGYVFSIDPTNLRDAVDALNSEIGARIYTESNYIVDDEDITVSIDKLDQSLKDIEENLASSSGVKYIEEVGSTIAKNTPHTLPGGLTYTPDGTVNYEGKNMDIFVNGQLLAADTGVLGANADRDYGEVSTTEVEFRFNVREGSNITYIVRQ